MKRIITSLFLSGITGKSILPFLLFLFCSAGFQSQEIIEIDLAKQESGKIIKKTVSQDVDHEIKIINKLPDKKYKYSFRTIHVDIPPLDVFKSSGKEIPQCRDEKKAMLEDYRKKLESESEEKQGAIIIKKMKELIKELELIKLCKEDEVVIYAKKIVESSEQTLQEKFEVKENQVVVFTIKRKDSDKEWIVRFEPESESRGTWLLSYGLSFISNIFKEHSEFIAEKKNDTLTVVSRFEKNRGEGDLAPVVFYSWLPTAQKESDIVFGPTLGLGYDLKNPVAFGGLILTYNWNLNLVLGACFRPVKCPNESFKEGLKIDASELENLNRNTIEVYPFIAFTFRFGSNPFSGK
ncbi:MAG: hypothetical protein EHM58_04845 [Ignavibacteriae bacterium]|nr:MAG: hypothetical protein EHM58_04845 [Ignavibacteriota bacterium]